MDAVSLSPSISGVWILVPRDPRKCKTEAPELQMGTHNTNKLLGPY